VLNNTIAKISRDNTAVTALLKLDIFKLNYTRVDLLTKPSNITLYLYSELNETIGEVKKSDNLTVDIARQ
jgi:hypothetical protein